MQQSFGSQQWKHCLEYISKRIKVESFDIWLKPTTGESDGNGGFRITVTNQFVADWIDKHYHDLIDEALREVTGHKFAVEYVLNEVEASDDQTSFEFTQESQKSIATVSKSVNPFRHNLNREYSFSSLVVGDFNEFACAASMAISEEPGTTQYNPLFIYGGTGLGKTHIALAIGNRIIELYTDKRIIYATSEQFTSDFISAISSRTISDFTRMYRNVDVLIIDDIQFLTGKESTQEQFFHTFNALHHAGKQIILTSDRPPKEIKGLEDRLLSRFSWGLVTDLQAPDLENRTAILYKKLESQGASLPVDVTRYIADKITSNIRELEGALIRLLAYGSLKGVPIDLEVARKVLADSITQVHKDISVDLIQRKTAEHFNIEPIMMIAKKKTAHIALARQVAMYLTRSLTRNSLKAIGKSFGGRDHSTVIHACDLVAGKMAEDHTFRDKIDKLSGALLY